MASLGDVLVTDPELLVAIVNRGRCLLAAGRLGAPVRVRMHPLDIAALRRTFTGDSDWTKPTAVVGCPLVGDCAVTRDWPIVEYDE